MPGAMAVIGQSGPPGPVSNVQQAPQPPQQGGPMGPVQMGPGQPGHIAPSHSPVPGHPHIKMGMTFSLPLVSNAMLQNVLEPTFLFIA